MTADRGRRKRKSRSKKVAFREKGAPLNSAVVPSAPTVEDIFPPAPDDVPLKSERTSTEMKAKSGPIRKYVPPVNVKATTIYLTPDQHAKVVRLAQQETDKLAARLGDVNMSKPPRISVSDFIRTLIDRQPL